jgi:sortase family protein
VRLIALLLGAVLLAGCGTEFVSDPPREPRPTFTPDEQLDPPPPVPDPTAVTIPKLDVHSSLIPLGLTDDCDYSEPPCLATPPVDQPGQAGWYAGRDPEVNGDEWQPGENGPAVIAGHVDGTGPDGQHGYPGVFKRLGELAPGDEILVDRNGAAQLRFVVAAVASFPKDAFPTEDVYLKTPEPTLRLITCGGDWDAAARHYRENVVVWADLAP